MIYPSADKLEAWGSKFALVTLAAKRAKQLKGGSPPRIDTDSRNPLTIALEEIALGKVITTVAETDALLVTNVEPEIAQLLALPTEAKENEEETETVAVTTDVDEDILVTDEEEWEEEAADEEDELPLDAGLDVDVDTEADATTAIVEELVDEEAKPKTRGRRKAVKEEEIPDIDLDIPIDEIEDDIDDDQELED